MYTLVLRKSKMTPTRKIHQSRFALFADTVHISFKIWMLMYTLVSKI
jgi:hypothetical protein